MSGSLETDSHVLGATPAAQIDAICDNFEAAYRQGQRPSIADFLQDCPLPQRESLFAELLQVELELGHPQANDTTYRHYLQTFPQFADVIETIAFKHGLQLPAGVQTGGGDSETIQQIAHFRLDAKLGSGGMGDVWRAWDARLKRTVAIKIPRVRELSEQELHRFLREGRTAAQLTHPGIVPVHEVGRDGNLAYIVSEFIDGQNLQQWLADRTVEPQRAAELCRLLAVALHHAHQRGIVHRDLKPSNVLLSADGNPHLVDFGIAKWSDDTGQLTLDGFAVGTPAFMSPEQARGDSAQVDCRADVYALGAILYRMLTGRLLFEGESPTAVLRAVLDDTPLAPRSIRRDIPRDLETICLKALEKEPSRRYASAAVMADDLERFLRSEPIVGRRPGLLEKTVRLVRKRPAAATAVLLGLLAASALGLATLLARENRSLLGLVPVTLETNPPGARIAFVPLDETTQEPQGDKAVYPSNRSPVSVELKPGNYFVIAALDDGRFHEVFRRVPKHGLNSGAMPSKRRDTPQRVILGRVDIPPLSVVADMAPIENAEDRGATTTENKQPAFYIDVKEVSYRDCDALQDLEPEGSTTVYGKDRDDPIRLNFNRACQIAEKMGKRLPTAAEFQQAASLPRISMCSHEDSSQSGFGPVGMPTCDRLGTTVPIAGLYSNVAEWTSTVVQAAEGGKTMLQIDLPVLANYRIVKGGDMTVIEGSPTLAGEHRQASAGYGVELYRVMPGVGMRCVRSRSPHYLPGL